MIRYGQERELATFSSQSQAAERERGTENGIALAAYESNRGFGISKLSFEALPLS